jgi:hypothetical protein
MAPTSFNISVQPDFWTRYRVIRTMSHRLWSVWAVYAIIVVAAVGWVIWMFVFGTDQSPAGTLDPLSLIPVAGMLLLVFVLVPLLQIYQLWTLSRHNRTLSSVHHYSITPDGFSARSEMFDVNLRWDAILEAVETKRFFFIYLSPRIAHFIPKERISSFPELEQLRAVLKTHLGERARLRSDGLG